VKWIALLNCDDRSGPPSSTRRKSRAQNQAIGRSKGGWTTKILTLTDALGNLVRFHLLPGRRYDPIGGIDFDTILADKAFDANWIIEEMNERGARMNRTIKKATVKRSTTTIVRNWKNIWPTLSTPTISGAGSRR
jgi:hypothetical protein